MRILELTAKPLHRIQFLNAAKGGGVESQMLPILQGRVDVLPEEQVLVLHQGPSGDATQFGNEQVTDLIRRSNNLLTICGHVHWQQPLAEIKPSSQILNVDSRAIVLTRGS